MGDSHSTYISPSTSQRDQISHVFRKKRCNGDQRVISLTSINGGENSILLARIFKTTDIIKYNRMKHLILRN